MVAADGDRGGQLASALERTAADYDATPYTSHAFPMTQPGRLSAIAHMFGLQAPSVATARVLELGCAAGGNLLPQAQRFPDARFLGVDLSGVQIEHGRRRLGRLGLKNIELRHGSITEVGEADGTFDYIICHGVYSWVPDAVREAILRICATRLADNGVAIVSYNVMPGWHLKRIARDAMLAHAAHIPDPTQKVGQAKALMNFLKDKVAQASPYGNALRTEAAFLANQRDDYVLHEYLEAENSPCTVTEFVLAAEKQGASYLAETEIHTMLAETYGEDTAKALRELAGNRLLPLEQYIDILTGRTFRQTILVKTEQARRAQRMLEPVRLMDLHLSGKFRLEPERTETGAFLFKDAADRTLTTASPSVATALEALAARYPATAEPRELIAIATRWADQPAAQEAAVLDALFRMANVGMIDFSTVPVRVGSASTDRPTASPFARLDAIEGAAYTASLRHEAINIDVPMRALLPLLDGTRDRAALTHGVLRIVTEGGLQLMRDGRPIEGDEARQKAAGEFVESALKAIESNALLEPT